MLRVLLITLIPVSGCVTGYTRDTERGIWPHGYSESDHTYYMIGWKQKFVVKPGRVTWPPTEREEVQ